MSLKKPKFWDYKKPNFISYLLYPISLLIRFTNLFKKKRKNNFKIKTICVGNIYLGGTGKTSLSIKINEILSKQNIKSCFIKKHYTNQKDELKLLANNAPVFSSSNRLDAIKEAEINNFHYAILDDGLQDKSIDCNMSIVCFNTLNWIGNGMTIPAGPLRENLTTLKNYRHLFINGNLENLNDLKNQILKINSQIEIHIGKYKITNLSEFNLNENYLVFSGIGNHKTFISMLKSYKFKIIKELEFPDHYNYSSKDIDKILSIANNLKCKIITTEKDILRLEKINSDKIKFIKSNLQILDEDKLCKAILKL
tara:strand:- start:3817 stop:4746 length:930 start_codon:yes stop_codon:yes gene_type:complete